MHEAEASKDGELNTLYEYQLDWRNGSLRQHIDGERTFVERYIPLAEFDALFGGRTLLTDRVGKSWFLGVWGRQQISRFKRVLKQRGAEFLVVRINAEDRIMRSYKQCWGNVASEQPH